MSENEQYNILWLTHRDPFHPISGGVGRTIKEVSTRLSEMGYKVTVYSSAFKGGKDIQQFNDVTILRYGHSIMTHVALPVFLFKNKFDIIINDLGHAVPWLTPLFFRKKNIVFFHHLHSRSLSGYVNPIISLAITAIEKCYFLIFKKQVFVSESDSAKSDLNNLKIKNIRFYKVPPGVDHSLFKSYPKTASPSLVYFGGLRKYKRPQESIYILKAVLSRFPDSMLFVVGSGEELHSMKKLAEKLGVMKKVVFTGKLGESQLAKIVGSSWLNLHTSVTEGWGFSILEASSAGTPTVAYNVAGVTDAIDNGINGFKVLDGDRDAFINAVFDILVKPKNWWISSESMAKEYNWDYTARNWDKIIRSLLME